MVGWTTLVFLIGACCTWAWHQLRPLQQPQQVPLLRDYDVEEAKGTGKPEKGKGKGKPKGGTKDGGLSHPSGRAWTNREVDQWLGVDTTNVVYEESDGVDEPRSLWELDYNEDDWENYEGEDGEPSGVWAEPAAPQPVPASPAGLRRRASRPSASTSEEDRETLSSLPEEQEWTPSPEEYVTAAARRQELRDRAQAAGGASSKGKGKTKGPLAAFDDRGLYRPGQGLRRRPPTPSPQNSEQEFKDTCEVAGPSAASDDAMPSTAAAQTPTTPGTEDRTPPMSDDDAGFGLHHGGAQGPGGALPDQHPGGVRSPGRAPGDAGAEAPAGAQACGAGSASSAGPQAAPAGMAAPEHAAQGPEPSPRPEDERPASVAEPVPPLPALFTTSYGTVYHARAGCGKLKCARRINRHEGCPTCPRWSRGAKKSERAERQHQENNAYLKQLVALYRKFFNTLNKERAKRAGHVWICCELLRAYFKLQQVSQCSFTLTTVTQSMQKDGFSPTDLPKAICVTFYFFWGKYLVFDHNLQGADEKLTWAFNNCPERALANRRRILLYLVPCKLRLGVLPTQELLHKYDLDVFVDVVKAIKEGNVQLFNNKMTELSADLIKMGTYLLMMKLKFMVMRNLTKGIFREVRGRLAEKTDKLDFTPFEHVFGWQDGCDADETAACLATLIYNGAIKGYLSHDRRKVVFAKDAPFPPPSKWR
eukprot:s1287_g8.t1